MYEEGVNLIARISESIAAAAPTDQSSFKNRQIAVWKELVAEVRSLREAYETNVCYLFFDL